MRFFGYKSLFWDTIFFFGIQNAFFGIQKFVLDFFGGLRVSSIVKLLLTFGKVKNGKGGVSTVGDPKAAAKAAHQEEHNQ